MDPQDRLLLATVEAAFLLIVIAMGEAALEWGRQNMAMAQAALQEKEREREMLMTKKKEMIAEQAAKEKLVDNFMVFIEAIENKDPEIDQKFDEKAMMNTILSMMKNDCGDDGDNGGFVGGDNVPNIELDLEATLDANIDIVNSNGNCGGDNGGFVGGNGGITNVPENAQNHGEEAMMAANNGTNSGGSEE